MTTNTVTNQDLVNYVLAGDAVNASQAFDVLAAQHIARTIETRRAEIASTWLTGNTPSPE